MVAAPRWADGVPGEGLTCAPAPGWHHQGCPQPAVGGRHHRSPALPGSSPPGRPRLRASPRGPPGPALGRCFSFPRLPAGGKAVNTAPVPGQTQNDESDRKTEPRSSVSDLVNSLTSEMLMVGAPGGQGHRPLSLARAHLGIPSHPPRQSQPTLLSPRHGERCRGRDGRAVRRDLANCCSPSPRSRARSHPRGRLWLRRERLMPADSCRRRAGDAGARGPAVVVAPAWHGAAKTAPSEASATHHPFSPRRSSHRAPRTTRATMAPAGRTWAASSSASATTSRSPP